MRQLILVSALLMTLSTGAFAAASTSEEATGPDLAPLKASIEAGNYDQAIVALKAVSMSAPSADVFNLLAYAQRKSGDLTNAALHYTKALEMDPKHKGALEYQGEMFLTMKDMDKAKANLAKLVELCPAGCEERYDLEDAIKKAGAEG